jgi:hypothetical protein
MATVESLFFIEDFSVSPGYCRKYECVFEAGFVMIAQVLQVVVTAMIVSFPAGAEEYVFHGDSEVQAGSAEDGGAYLFAPREYSPYAQQRAQTTRQNTVESLPYERWSSTPQSPYGIGQPAPWGRGYGGYSPGSGGYGPNYFPGGVGTMPFTGMNSPFGIFPGGGFPLPW